MLTCLRYRVSGANDASEFNPRLCLPLCNFYLWTLAMRWRTLICRNYVRLTCFPGKEENNCLGSWHLSASALSASGSTNLESPFFEHSLPIAWIRYDMILQAFDTWRKNLFKRSKFHRETDIQLKGKHQSRHLKFDRGEFLAGMKGKAEACSVSCFHRHLN